MDIIIGHLQFVINCIDRDVFIPVKRDKPSWEVGHIGQILIPMETINIVTFVSFKNKKDQLKNQSEFKQPPIGSLPFLKSV